MELRAFSDFDWQTFSGAEAWTAFPCGQPHVAFDGATVADRSVAVVVDAAGVSVHETDLRDGEAHSWVVPLPNNRLAAMAFGRMACERLAGKDGYAFEMALGSLGFHQIL